MNYNRAKTPKINRLKVMVQEMDSEDFILKVAEDSIFGLWMNDLYKPLGYYPKIDEEKHLKNFYQIHIKNLAAHPKAYLTNLKYICWN